MTCKKCIRFNECAKGCGETRFYGKEYAANNVEDLCPLYAAYGAVIPNRFAVVFRHENINKICRDITTITERHEEYKIISTNMTVYNGELCVLVFFEREAR